MAFKRAIRKQNKEMLDLGGGVDFTSGANFSAGSEFTSGANFATGEDFAVSVRAAEPVLKFGVPQKKSGFRNLSRNLLQNIAGTAIIAAVLSLFCIAGGFADLIPFMMAGPAVFIIITMVEAVRPGKTRLILAAVILVLLIAAIIVWHGRIGGGLATMMNDFYNMAEEAQAYLYSRFSVSDSASVTFAAVWISSLLGLIVAIPPADNRRPAIILLALAVMFLTAYYGMIPSWICIAVILAALILTVSRGSILSVLPLLLAGMLVFGAIIMIDPGENYGISRMDENFRDRFAFHSALIESNDLTQEETDELEGLDENEETEEEDANAFDGEYKTYAAIGTFVLIAALAGAAVYFLMRRLKKKQAAVRAGINSSDPKTAVTAMFPYSVRWLKACGVGTDTTREEPFSSLAPSIRGELAPDYGDRFDSMYALWKEAAYSNHPVSEESRQDMKTFMGETIKLAKAKCTAKEKLKIKFKYTL